MTPILLTFIAVFLLILSGGLLLFHRDALLRRLENVVSPQTGSTETWIERLMSMGNTASLAKAIDPFQKVLPRSPEELSVAQRRLLLAGY